jgi:hypothetical protein
MWKSKENPLVNYNDRVEEQQLKESADSVHPNQRV